jgi:hypothetical protein
MTKGNGYPAAIGGIGQHETFLALHIGMFYALGLAHRHVAIPGDHLMVLAPAHL